MSAPLPTASGSISCWYCGQVLPADAAKCPRCGVTQDVNVAGAASPAPGAQQAAAPGAAAPGAAAAPGVPAMPGMAATRSGWSGRSGRSGLGEAFAGRPAGVGARLGAFTLDVLVVLILAAAAAALTRSALMTALIALEAALINVGVQARTGASVGNALFRVRVSRRDAPYSPGFGRSVLRAAIAAAGWLVAVVGAWLVVLSAAWDPRGLRRTWADLAAGTVVVAVPRAAAAPAVAQAAAFRPTPGIEIGRAPAPLLSPAPPQQAPAAFGQEPPAFAQEPPAFGQEPPAFGQPPASPFLGRQAEPPFAPPQPAPPAPPFAQPAAPTPAPQAAAPQAAPAPVAPERPLSVPGPAAARAAASAFDTSSHSQSHTARPPAAAAVPAAPAGPALAAHPSAAFVESDVTVLLTFDTGQRETLPLPATVLLGRSAEPAEPGEYVIAVRDPESTVSKRHARLELTGEGTWVTDTGSTNGVDLIDEEGHELAAAPGSRTYVEDGVRIRLGNRVFTLIRLIGDAS